MNTFRDGARPLTPEDERRWRNAENFDPNWSARSQLAAGFIDSSVRSVCDIGCGMQSLKQFLRSEVKYLPADLQQWTPDTEVCDINAGIFPRRSILESDQCVALGLIEYLSDPSALFRFIGECRKRFIVSYNTLEDSPERNPIWISAFTSKQFLGFASSAGLRLIELRRRAETELIFHFHPT